MCIKRYVTDVICQSWNNPASINTALALGLSAVTYTISGSCI